MSFPITGVSLVSALGRGPATHRRALFTAPEPALPLGQLLGQPDAAWANFCARPLPDSLRAALGRFAVAPASALAVWLARDCLADAGRRLDELAGPRTGLFIASSRGNLAGWQDPWPGRRSRAVLAASNSAHAELASAVQRELALDGPVHLGAEGCAAGLSALSLAHTYLKAGEIDRALVIALDLPLTPSIIASYAQTGMLGNGSARPFAASANGMIPAEGGAAVLLERNPPGGPAPHPLLEESCVRHEAFHLLHSDPQASRLTRWLGEMLPPMDSRGATDSLIFCPHASGTLANCRAEKALCRQLEALLDQRGSMTKPDYWVPRPWTGHAIAATGLIDLALAVHCLRDGLAPPLSRQLDHAATDARNALLPSGQRAQLLNWSLGIGGQFAACRVRSPQTPAISGASLEFSVRNRTLRVLDEAGVPLVSLPCSSAAKGTGFVEGSHQTPTGRFVIREKYGHAAAPRTVFESRRATGIWGDDDAQGTRVTHGILRLDGLDAENANTWDRFVYIHGTNQLAYPPENRSHGCLTLAEADFRTLFHLVPEGATLTVTA